MPNEVRLYMRFPAPNVAWDHAPKLGLWSEKELGEKTPVRLTSLDKLVFATFLFAP